MITATLLEVLMLAAMLHGAGPWRIFGVLVWCFYLRYSATRTAIEALVEWLDDQDNPPGGAA
jgi:hypothetical protein